MCCMSKCFISHQKQGRPEENTKISLKCRQAGRQTGRKEEEERGEEGREEGKTLKEKKVRFHQNQNIQLLKNILQ